MKRSLVVLVVTMVFGGMSSGSVEADGPPLCPSVPENLVQNCAFEEPALQNAIQPYVAGQEFAGWTVDAGGVEIVNEPNLGQAYPVHSGDQSLDLNEANSGTIYQDLATVAGRRYELTFQLSGYGTFFCGTTLTKVVRVTAGDVDEQFSFTASSAGDPGEQAFEEKSVVFTAQDSTTRLTFASQITGCTGPVIDDVTVTPYSPPNDVDCDGDVDPDDVLAILNELVGVEVEPLPQEPCKADKNGSGGTDLGDAITVRRGIAGLD